MALKPQTDDEKQLVLARIVRDLKRLRQDAGPSLEWSMLAYILATAQDEAETQLAVLEGETFTD